MLCTWWDMKSADYNEQLKSSEPVIGNINQCLSTTTNTFEGSCSKKVTRIGE